MYKMLNVMCNFVSSFTLSLAFLFQAGCRFQREYLSPSIIKQSVDSAESNPNIVKMNMQSSTGISEKKKRIFQMKIIKLSV